MTNVALNVSRTTSGPESVNAVLPAWRGAIFHAVLTIPWNTAPDSLPAMLANQRKMTEEFVPRLRKLAPQSGAYLNEADFRQKDFQWVYYGRNYDRLKQVKGVYDPEGVFYASKAIGSENWEQRQDGRLCRLKRILDMVNVIIECLMLYHHTSLENSHHTGHLFLQTQQVNALGPLNRQAQRTVPDQLRQRTQRPAHAERHRVVQRLLESVVVEKYSRSRVDVGVGVLGLAVLRQDNRGDL